MSHAPKTKTALREPLDLRSNVNPSRHGVGQAVLGDHLDGGPVLDQHRAQPLRRGDQHARG